MENDNIFFVDEELMHYGTPRHSGRYPWGSGENPYQHSGDFLSRIDAMRKKGLSETEIAESFKKVDEYGNEYAMSTTELRDMISIATMRRRQQQVANVKKLAEEGLSNVAIAEKLGLAGESTVRSLLKSDSEARMNIAEKTAENLKKMIDENGMLYVGKGTETQLGISNEKLRVATTMLELQGYEMRNVRIEQQTNPGKYTMTQVLCPPGSDYKDTYSFDKINYIENFVSPDDGDTIERKTFVYPASLDSSRLAIRYAEDGGLQKDGVIELRRGVKDISLGTSNYSQIRMLVDGTHYLKGMAVYSDDLPEGVDVLFNTNKPLGTPMKKVLKEIKKDPDNPFGSAIKEQGGQSYYIGDDGKEHLSLINKRADAGDWNDWSKEFSSQFLSKQPVSLIKQQIGLTKAIHNDEYQEIMELTNPTIKKAFLEDFADACDYDSVHLKAASLPNTVYKVILPVSSLKDDECYNPSLMDGEKVALVRYPHGGTFEIPILTNNTRNSEGKSVLGNTASDAIGINSNVASILSGADFDGDTVMVIPLRKKGEVKATPQLFENFDPTMAYGPDPAQTKIIDGKEHYFRNGIEYALLGEDQKQKQMGIVSNLITDMTLKDAPPEELARAVKHSMVIIDATKHNLDFKQSELDNGIKELKDKYQIQYDEETGRSHHGAATLISKAKSIIRVPERAEGGYFLKDSNKEVLEYDKENHLFVDQETGEIFNRDQVNKLKINPNTGEKAYHETGKLLTDVTYKTSEGKKVTTKGYVKKDGIIYYKGEDGYYTPVKGDEKITYKPAVTKTTAMSEVKDAKALSSGTLQEEIYADYANYMKSMANTARKEAMAIVENPYSPAAKETYIEEVESLNYKYNQAMLNKPRESHAQAIAATKVKAKLKEDPHLNSEQKAKLRQNELVKARALVGAKRHPITLTDREWSAIQAGAISKTRLREMIPYMDKDVLRKFAMPKKESPALSQTRINRMIRMANAGYTTAEIAKEFNISTSTVINYIKGGE